MGGGPAAGELWASLKRAYEKTGFEPLWLHDGKATRQVAVLKQAVQGAAEDGLDPARYDLRAADTLLSARPGGLFRDATVGPEALADADVRLSWTFLRFLSHVERGRVAPGQVDKHWFGVPRQGDLGQALLTSAKSDRLAEDLDRARPRHPQYAALKQVLARYRDIAERGGWPAVPSGVALRPGQAHPAVAVLRARLAASGELAADAAPAGSAAPAASTAPAGPVFDKALQEALKRFERRHGLVADGRLDREALAALNVPVEARIRQVELNLERWRWLPESFGERYVLVNIPTFHLQGVRDGQTEIQMRVVAGKQDTQTPIFSDEMTTVVFSPYWNVPYDIARNETIPAVMRDPGYVYRNNMEVVRGSRVVDPWSVDWSRPGNVGFRQRPGASNALGGVKFLFPNEFDVYLHDTPADALFARIERDYSHGCVRVEKPFELAQWVLSDQSQWTPERIRAAMRSGREQHVALKQKIGVFIVYQTVWANDDGTVEFRDDVYGHDAVHARMLPGAPEGSDVRTADGASSRPAGAAAGSVRRVSNVR